VKDHQTFEYVTAELHRYLFPHSVVKQNQKIKGRSGVLRQVDILVEDIVGICPIKIVIDCKYYKTKVDINTVDEVWGLVDDVRANYGMIVCNTGFTEGAMGRANEKGLKLCSILDLQNKEFSIKPKFPVVIETSEPTFDLVITPKNLQASLSLNPKEVIIKNLSSQEIINSYQLFFNYSKEDKIKIPEDGVIILEPNEWRLITSDEEIKIPYRFLCNRVQPEDVKARPDLAFRLFCYIPLHKIRYGIPLSGRRSRTSACIKSRCEAREQCHSA